MSSPEVSDVSINEMASDTEMSTYSSGSELNMDALTCAATGTEFSHSRDETQAQPPVPDSLLKAGAKVFAKHMPFETIYYSHFIVPEEMQKLIAFYSFPSNDENIRLYSCLSAGGSHSYNDGAALLAKNAVRDCVQIGFYLSANVLAEAPTQPTSPKFTPVHRVSLMFDRTCITSCSCTCTLEVEGIQQQQRSLNQRNDHLNDSQSYSAPLSLPVTDSVVWCAHVVATCLKRIRSPESVTYRPPISESLSKLNKNELQLFAQQLICHVGARKILPAAQSILDDILLPHVASVEDCVQGQDPTAGGLLGETSSWRFAISTLEEKLRTTLIRFSKTKSPFHGDLSSINSCLSHHSEEMTCILRSLRTYEPRGVWDLLTIIVKMFRKKDLNALFVLQLLTRCVVDVDEIMFWWYLVQLNIDMPAKPSQVGKRKQSCYGAAWLCEALVDVWRLVCLDPKLREEGSSLNQLISKLSNWHQAAITRAQKGMRVAQFPSSAGSSLLVGLPENLRDLFSENNQKLFVGFKPAIKACQLSWTPEMPSTHTLTTEQFIQALPHFDGAFVDENSIGLKACSEPLNSHESIGCQSYPSMIGRFGTNFARCQGLVMHGKADEALAWVRHLALEMLFSAPSFVAAGRSAALQNLKMASQIDKLTDSIRPADRVACLNSTGPTRRHRRIVATAVVNTSTGTAFGATTSRRGGGAVSGSRRTTSNTTPQRPPEVQQLAKLWSNFYVSKVAEFSSTLTEWIYFVEYLMDCLYGFHHKDGLVCPPSLSNLHLTRSSAHGGNSGVGSYSQSSMATTGATSNNKNADEWFSLDTELAFRLGLLMLALQRPQHIVTATEVRLFDHEALMLSRLYRLPLDSACPWVIESVRHEAQLLSDGDNRFSDCSFTYVPYSLGDFLFQMLAGSEPIPPSNTPPTPPPNTLPQPSGIEDIGECENSSSRSAYAVSDNATAGGSNLAPSSTQPLTAVFCLPFALRIQQHVGNFHPDPDPSALRTHETRDDSELAFALAQYIFGHRTYIPESVAPMFVECQRSQMSSFILRVLRYYKDNSRRISDLIQSLLDISLNSSFKSPPLWLCLSASLEEILQFRFESEVSSVNKAGTGRLDCIATDKVGGAQEAVAASFPPEAEKQVESEEQKISTSRNIDDASVENSVPNFLGTSVSFGGVESTSHRTSSTSAGEDTETPSDSKAWNERFRCATLRDPKKLDHRSVGLAALDSSAPETTSSDNSPTTSRKTFLSRLYEEELTPTAINAVSEGNFSANRGGNGDSSSDCPSSSTGEESKPVIDASTSNKAFDYSISSRRNVSENAMKNQPADKRCGIPRQRPTESYAQHLFMLAKSIRLAAGGPNASVSLFNAEAVMHGPTNRNLHFAAFQVSLYALGLINLQQPSWKSRTYSSHVAWISQQVVEMELPAAFMLLHSWRNHFTIEEVTAVAYELFKKGNQHLSRMAAELCLASLTDCTTLKSEATKCALSQLSAMPEMLERGLLCIEKGVNAAPFGIVPDLHFQLASYWLRLYETIKDKLPSKHVPVTAVEEQPPIHNRTPCPSGFQEPVCYPSAYVYFPTPSIDSITVATAAGSAFVPSFAQPFSLPFYPAFPVQPPQQVRVHFPPMQQLTMQSVASSVYEFYSRQPHLYPTSASSSITQGELQSSIPATQGIPNTVRQDVLTPSQEYETSELELAEVHDATQFYIKFPSDLSTNGREDESIIKELEGRARYLLLRSFHAFLSGIEKLFPSQISGRMQTQSRSWSGNFCHWQHRHSHLDSDNVFYLFQQDLPNDSRNVDSRTWAGCAESPGSSEVNILRALNVAELLGDAAVSVYCKRMIQCIPCPLIMSAITVKVLEKHYPYRLSSPSSSSSPVVYPQYLTGEYPWTPSVTTYPLTHQRPLNFAYPQWEEKYVLQQQQQTRNVPVSGSAASEIASGSNPLNSELFEKMVNRIHYLFHFQVNQHLRGLSRAQERWGDLVDMVLSAYLASQRMPPTNQTLTWECLFRRIEQYSRSMPALLERIIACIETVNMRLPPSSIAPTFAATKGLNGVPTSISIPSGGVPPPPARLS